MADSPSKRRKTSLTTSFPIEATGTPSRTPVLRQEGAKTLPGRPSFASPTRASLARHNPQLLNRPSSSGSGSDRPGSRGKNLQDVFEMALSDARPVVEGQMGFLVENADPRSESTTQENELSKEDLHRTTAPRKSTRLVGGGLSAKPRRMSRSPAKSTRKPAERPAVEDEPGLDDITNPFQKKGLRRSPIPSQANSVQPNSQVDSQKHDSINPFKKMGLRRSSISQPAAPVELSNTQTEGPLEFSTTPPGPPPSQAIQPAPMSAKQPQGEVIPAIVPTEEPLVSQPAVLQAVEPVEVEQPRQEVPAVETLSQPRIFQVEEITHIGRRNDPGEPELPPTPTQRGLADPIVTTPPTGIHDTPSKRARRNKALAAKLKSSPLKPRDPPPEERKKTVEPQSAEVKAKPEKSKRRKSARFLIPEDPYASKKKVRDDLLKELQQLQKDVALGNQENERLRLRQESRKTTAATPTDPDELMAMLKRSTTTEPESIPKPQPKSIFESIAAFLPFGPRRKVEPAAVISEKPLPSHLPIDLQDPLPYLQAFSPLTYTSRIILLPTETTSSESSPHECSQPTLQQHLIFVSHPSGFFASRISMLVDTSNFSISSLEILKLDASAEDELGPFVRERASGEGTLGKDISVVCWAMGRWVEVALSRARFWCALETEWGNAEAMVKSLERVKSKSKKRKRQRTVVEGEGELNEPNDEDKEIMEGKWARRQLLSHMGRTNMEISNEDVELRFEWKIGFDWTGEVESSISANARVPRNWQEGDDRDSLSKVPETFKRLVREKGPLGAVRSVVGLLMSAG